MIIKLLVYSLYLSTARDLHVIVNDELIYPEVLLTIAAKLLRKAAAAWLTYLRRITREIIGKSQRTWAMSKVFKTTRGYSW